jgi:hypothetical protein
MGDELISGFSTRSPSSTTGFPIFTTDFRLLVRIAFAAPAHASDNRDSSLASPFISLLT